MSRAQERSRSSGLALLSRPLGSSSARRPPNFLGLWRSTQHPFWAGLRRRRQKAERADRGLPAHLLQGGRDLVLSLSSARLGSALSHQFSRPAAQHPLWAGLRRRRPAYIIGYRMTSVARRRHMQSTGGSLSTSLIESRKCELVKAISIEHCRSTEHVPAEQFYGLGAFQPVKSCR
jgi:hypothetical protein